MFRWGKVGHHSNWSAIRFVLTAMWNFRKFQHSCCLPNQSFDNLQNTLYHIFHLPKVWLIKFTNRILYQLTNKTRQCFVATFSNPRWVWRKTTGSTLTVQRHSWQPRIPSGKRSFCIIGPAPLHGNITVLSAQPKVSSVKRFTVGKIGTETFQQKHDTKY